MVVVRNGRPAARGGKQTPGWHMVLKEAQDVKIRAPPPKKGTKTLQLGNKKGLKGKWTAWTLAMMDPLQLVRALWRVLSGRKRVIGLFLVTMLHCAQAVVPDWDGTTGVWVHKNGTTRPLNEINLNGAVLPNGCTHGHISTIHCPDADLKGPGDLCWGKDSFTVRYNRCGSRKRRSAARPSSLFEAAKGRWEAETKVENFVATITKTFEKNRVGCLIGIGVGLSILKVPTWLILGALGYMSFANVAAHDLHKMKPYTDMSVTLGPMQVAYLQAQGTTYVVQVTAGRYAPVTAYRTIGRGCSVVEDESDYHCMNGNAIDIKLRNKTNVICEHRNRDGGWSAGCFHYSTGEVATCVRIECANKAQIHEIYEHDYQMDVEYGVFGLDLVKAKVMAGTAFHGEFHKSAAFTMYCSEDLDDVSDRFVYIKENAAGYLYPKPAAAEVKGVQVTANGTLFGLQNLVEWTTASASEVHFLLNEAEFDPSLIVDNAETPHRVHCDLKIAGEFTEHHVPPCTSATLGAPEYRQDGRYTVKVSEGKATTYPCEVDFTSEGASMLTPGLTLQSWTASAEALFVPRLGLNKVCFGETCVSIEHKFKVRDVMRKITEFKGLAEKKLLSWGIKNFHIGFPSWSLPNWMYGAGLMAAGVTVRGPMKGPLMVSGLAAMVIGQVVGQEWGCTIDFNRKMINCGRGIFATDETMIGGYAALVQNETLIAQYMVKKANRTDGVCFSCMSEMQCTAMERLVDIAVAWGPTYGLQTEKVYVKGPPIFDWSESAHLDVEVDGKVFPWLRRSIPRGLVRAFTPKLNHTVNITLIHAGQQPAQCTEILNIGLEPVKWYRSFKPTLVYRTVPVVSRECQNSTIVSATRGGITIHTDEAQWLVTNATQIVEMHITQLRGCTWPDSVLVGGYRKGFMRKSAGLASPQGAELPGYARPGPEFWERVPFGMQLQWCPGTNVTVDPNCVKRTSKYANGPDGLIKNWCTSEERSPVSFVSKEGCFFPGEIQPRPSHDVETERGPANVGSLNDDDQEAEDFEDRIPRDKEEAYLNMIEFMKRMAENIQEDPEKAVRGDIRQLTRDMEIDGGGRGLTPEELAGMVPEYYVEKGRPYRKKNHASKPHDEGF